MKIQTTQVIYKTVGETQLKMHLFIPTSEIKPEGKRGLILFLHGGGFIQGHPAQFFPHCRYLATRGIVAASAAYRVLGKTATSVRDCLADGKSAIRWLRTRAEELAVDPTKIVAAGGSAGANIAANAAMMAGGDEVDEDLAVSSKPNALILFSPAIIRPIIAKDLIDEQLYASLTVRPNIPPMLLFHGSEDEFFAGPSMQQFCEEMTAAGNLCELRLYPGQKHGFFNYGNQENRPFYETLMATDHFLGQLGLLDQHPTLTPAIIPTLRHAGDWQT